MSLPRVSIIGTGNLATHLAKGMEKAGFLVAEIYNRHLSKAAAFANSLYDAQATDSLDFLDSEANVFFLCVSDNAIATLAQEIILPRGALLVHCSGATNVEAIMREDVDYGVFYPIQTFSPNRKISFEGLPICLEASTEEAEEILESLVKRMKANPFFMSSEQRLTLHLSAVFACNFSNHFYRIAQEVLDTRGLPFDLLHHLIAETVQKAFENGPENAQTGPAVREDYNTMALHRDLLRTHPEWKELYVKVSEDIIRLAEEN